MALGTMNGAVKPGRQVQDGPREDFAGMKRSQEAGAQGVRGSKRQVGVAIPHAVTQDGVNCAACPGAVTNPWR